MTKKGITNNIYKTCSWPFFFENSELVVGSGEQDKKNHILHILLPFLLQILNITIKYNITIFFFRR